jgi:ubiquinone/menaquinone biosynthesis C-methylase UbiE
MEAQRIGKICCIVSLPVHTTNEAAASAAFSRQSGLFDALYSSDTIIRYKRRRVWQHLEKYLSPQSTILELNAGTGEDAIRLAGDGHHVHATDIAEGMLARLADKVKQHRMQSAVSYERCSFTGLEMLENKGPYDCIFSNFAGLNCTQDLDKVLGSFSPLVKPGGFVTLVLLPKFCLWEFLLLVKGKFKTAFRRFAGNKGARAHIEGHYFRCWYYNPGFVRKQLGNSFTLIALEGLCTIVPPSYITGFAEKHPRLYRFLEKMENKWHHRWPWKSIGDYYIITLQKKL